MVSKSAFHHIYQLVIAVWIGWQEKEPRVNQVANGVVHDPLHNFAIEKLNPHPNPMNNGCLGMKIQLFVTCVTFEAIHVKDGLDVLGRNFFDKSESRR